MEKPSGKYCLWLVVYKPVARIFHGGSEGGRGGAYFKNRDQKIDVGVIGHTSGEDTRPLERPGACFPGKSLKFENFKLLEMHFCVILNILQSYDADHFGSWKAHPADSPCLRAWYIYY